MNNQRIVDLVIAPAEDIPVEEDADENAEPSN